MIQKRTKVNSSKVNLIISAVFHTVLVVCIFYFAAKEGLLGKKLKQITATIEHAKKPEPPKEKPQEPKVEQPKAQEAKAAVPQARETAAAPPPTTAAPEAAPAAVATPSFGFSDGAIAVDTMNDPNTIYKTLVEHALHTYWNRPEDMADDNFVAEIELTVDKSGEVQDWRWVTHSGNTRWDQSVQDAVAQLKSIGKAPPKGFPKQFVVRFDVQSEQTQPLQFGIR